MQHFQLSQRTLQAQLAAVRQASCSTTFLHVTALCAVDMCGSHVTLYPDTM